MKLKKKNLMDNSVMRIRKYRDGDCETVSQLFYDTVHTVNAKDYSSEQLAAWANSPDCLKSRREDLISQETLIAEINGVIVGFGSIDNSGCLDLLFVRKDYLNQGVASALCNELEKGFSVVRVFSSVTAKSFFENRGYIVVKSQEAERLGIKLKNYEMEKKNKT